MRETPSNQRKVLTRKNNVLVYDALGLTLQTKVNSSRLYFAEPSEPGLRNKDSHCQEVVVAYHNSAGQKQLVTIQLVPPSLIRNGPTNIEAVLVLACIVDNDCFSYSSILEFLGHRGIHEGSWASLSLAVGSEGQHPCKPVLRIAI